MERGSRLNGENKDYEMRSFIGIPKKNDATAFTSVDSRRKCAHVRDIREIWRMICDQKHGAHSNRKSYGLLRKAQNVIQYNCIKQMQRREYSQSRFRVSAYRRMHGHTRFEMRE